MDMKRIIAFIIASAVAAGACFNACAQTTGARTKEFIDIVQSYSAKTIADMMD